MITQAFSAIPREYATELEDSPARTRPTAASFCPAENFLVRPCLRPSAPKSS